MRHFFFIVVLLQGALALANSNDVQLTQLDNNQFHTLVRELGASITSATLSPPETLGHNGFSLVAEESNAYIKSTPLQTPLNIPSLHARKGLPFSFELGSRLAWITSSGMVAATFEAKWALNEGYSYLPDIAVRGHITGLFGARDLNLGVGGADLSIGKKFAVAGMMTFTPYAGWDLNWVGGSASPSSGLDFSPVLARDNFYSRFYGGLRWIGGIAQLGLEASYVPFSDIPSLFAFSVAAGFSF